MADAFSRWSIFCDAEIHSSARNAPRVRLTDYVDDLIARSERQEAYRLYDRETRISRISHARYVGLPNGSQGLAMVVTLGDQRGANPGFVHFRRGHAREAERQEGEVKGLSAHCVIELTEHVDHVGRHRMLLEEAKGIGRTPITLLLRSELRAISTGRDERFVDPETNGRNQLRPVLEVWPQQSRQMREAIERGTLGMVELFDTRPVPEFDEHPEFSVRRRALRVRVTPGRAGTAAALDRLKGIARDNGYGNMSVSWRFEGGEVSSAEIHTDMADIGTAMFAHRELIEVEHAMSDCVDRLNDEFVGAMVAHFV